MILNQETNSTHSLEPISGRVIFEKIPLKEDNSGMIEVGLVVKKKEISLG